MTDVVEPTNITIPAAVVGVPASDNLQKDSTGTATNTGRDGTDPEGGKNGEAEVEGAKETTDAGKKGGEREEGIPTLNVGVLDAQNAHIPPVNSPKHGAGITPSTSTPSLETSYRVKLAAAKDDAVAARAEAEEAKGKQQEAEESLALIQQEMKDIQDILGELEETTNQQASLIDTKMSEMKAETDRKIKAANDEAAVWRAEAVAGVAKVQAARDTARADAQKEIDSLKRDLEEARQKLEAAGGSASPLKVSTSTTGSVRSAGLAMSSSTTAPATAIQEPRIVPDPTTSYLCRSIFPTTDDVSSNNPAIFSPKRLWANGQVITYHFIDGHVNQHVKVTKVIPEWSRYANVTFKLVSDDALISISFKNSWECWSHIGTDAHTTTANPPYTMALGPISPESPHTTRGDRALILHQFGHVLGLVHEHLCPAETDAVSLKQDVIFKHPSFRKSNPSIGKHMSVYANNSVTNYASPDPSSIMVFSMPGELNEGNFTIEPNVALSPLDKAFMVINYPRARVHSQASEWTLRHALLIANIDERTSRIITEEHDLVKRRALFADFLSAARQRDVTDFVDPAPEIVHNLSLPPVQSALHAFFMDPEKHSRAKEILADPELKEELIVVLDRLATHRIIYEVVQRGKIGQAQPEVSDRTRAEPTLVNSLLNVALMLHGAANYQHPFSNRDGKDKEPKEVDIATALYMQLAQHATFRVAMEQAVEVSSMEVLPDVSGLVTRLAARPTVLRAVRHALHWHV